MKVVVIEDDAGMALLTQTELELQGHQVFIVSEDFHHLLFKKFWKGIDVAVIDLMLGSSISGIHIATWLKEHEPEVKRIIYSGISTDIFDDTVSELGDRWIQKPPSGTGSVSAAIRELTE